MSLKKLRFRINQIRKRLGTRVLIYTFMSLVVVVLARRLGAFIPDIFIEHLSQLDVQPILTSLSGTMLTISTFSLSIVVTANSNAVSSTTPRAFRLLLEDQGTQDMLARFLGAFVFSAIALMVLPLGYFGGGGQVVLFVITVWIVIVIISTFIRWTLVIRELGSMSYAFNKIERATIDSVDSYFATLRHRTNILTDDLLTGENTPTPLFYDSGKYIQLIDEEALQNVADNAQLKIYINRIEGDFVTNADPLVYVTGHVDQAIRNQISDAFYFGDARSIEDDPRFGLVMLNQTASKALSPGINDPGTAINALHAAYRVLLQWRTLNEDNASLVRVWKRPIDAESMLKTFFEPIVHDAGDNIAVQLEVLRTLGALRKSTVPSLKSAAETVAKSSFERAKRLLQDPSDIQTLNSVYVARGFEQATEPKA